MDDPAAQDVHEGRAIGVLAVGYLSPDREYREPLLRSRARLKVAKHAAGTRAPALEYTSIVLQLGRGHSGLLRVRCCITISCLGCLPPHCVARVSWRPSPRPPRHLPMTIHFVQFVVEIQTVRCHADSPKLSLPLRQRGKQTALPVMMMAMVATRRSPALVVGYQLMVHH